MFDRAGNFIKYDTEEEMLAVLQGDRLNPNLQPYFQQAMVVDAASHGWHAALDHMLTHMGYSVDDKDHKNYTPLGYAAMNGRTKTVKKLLLEYDADPIARNNTGPHMFMPGAWFPGYTAIELALGGEHWGTAELFLTVADTDIEDYLFYSESCTEEEVQEWARKLETHNNLAFIWRGVLAYKRARPAMLAWLERAQIRLGAYASHGVARARDAEEYEAMWQ